MQSTFLSLICRREECQICLEHKTLYNFCDHHKFCNSCCKKWCKTSILCPTCRNQCTNTQYLTFNYDLFNIEYDKFKRCYEDFFYLWHKPYCIKKKHKFKIIVSPNNIAIRFICNDCNIEEVFPI